jgi:histidinol-phosphate aminotransferase
VSATPRPWLEKVEGYRPGLRAASTDGSLASNESPLGISGLVAEAIAAEIPQAYRYPDPLADELRAELARRHGVDPEQILVGNGSDELIYLLALAYLAGGGHAVTADPAYRIDETSTAIVNARLTKVPLADWKHDLRAMADVEADIAYVVNPHNPTATVRGREEIERFARNCRSALVVVDEAYIDFTDDPDALTCMPLVAQGRVAVLRTFSKIGGLAGLRIGYLVATQAVVAALRSIRQPFSVGTLAQAAALAALRDRAYYLRVRDHVLRTREIMVRVLGEAGLEVIPSQANFVLVRTPDEAGLVGHLADHGLTVRPGSGLGIPGTVRMSVPSQAGLDLLRRALSTLHSPA